MPSMQPARTRSAKLVRAAVVIPTALATAALSAVAWAAPRGHVTEPGPRATPSEVARAYARAIDARDFATANAIDGRPGQHLGRYSRPGRVDDVHVLKVFRDGRDWDVIFSADFRGGDATLRGRQVWGYLLERAADGRLHIVDEGVA